MSKKSQTKILDDCLKILFSESADNQGNKNNMSLPHALDMVLSAYKLGIRHAASTLLEARERDINETD